MKCILLVRVSTEKQSFDEQETELFNLAVSEGYLPENIIPICYKESGIKLEEDERAGLNDMKKYIVNDSTINCVYVWEISRISRKKKILFSILDFLTQRKIQLVIKSPLIRLLNEDGSINEASETVFTMFSQLAESEMRNKNYRFKRGKNENKKKGRFNGGKIKYGYRVDENGYIKVDDVQANEIRNIVHTYITSTHSQLSLYAELQQRGNKLKYSSLRKLLTDWQYYIDKGQLYKPFLSAEEWEKVEAKNASNNKVVDKGKRNWLLGAKLIKCQCCGKTMLAHLGTGSYFCKYATKQHNYQCNNHISININAVESIVWHYASLMHWQFLSTEKDTQLREYAQRLLVAEEKLTTALQYKEVEYTERMEKLVEQYVMGRITQNKYNTMVAKLEDTGKENDQFIQQIKNEIEHLKKLMSDLSTENKDSESWFTKWGKEKDTTPLHFEDMYNIAHQHVQKLEVESEEVDLPNGKRTKCTLVKLWLYGELQGWKNGLGVYYNPMAKRNVNEKFFIKFEDGHIQFMPIRWVERINRHNALKARKAKQQAEE